MRSFSDHDLKQYIRQSYAMIFGAAQEDFSGVEGWHLTMTVAPSDIRVAYGRIRGHIRRTPLLETASPIAGALPLSLLKLECLQATGSFKARAPSITFLRDRYPRRVAPLLRWQSRRSGRFRRPEARDPRARLRAGNRLARQDREDQGLRGGSGDRGRGYAEAQERCDAYVAESGALLIHPYDAVETVAGQGTVALEWEEDVERLGLELDTVLIAVGGGGLIAGVAAWFQGRVKVVGVEPEGSRALLRRSKRTSRLT